MIDEPNKILLNILPVLFSVIERQMIRSTLKHKKIQISEKVENLYLNYMYIAKLLNLHVLVSVI